jgi:hypothetical protein
MIKRIDTQGTAVSHGGGHRCCLSTVRVAGISAPIATRALPGTQNAGRAADHNRSSTADRSISIARGTQRPVLELPDQAALRRAGVEIAQEKQPYWPGAYSRLRSATTSCTQYAVIQPGDESSTRPAAQTRDAVIVRISLRYAHTPLSVHTSTSDRYKQE